MTIQFAVNWIIVLSSLVYYLLYSLINEKYTVTKSEEFILSHVITIIVLLFTPLFAQGLVFFQNWM